ncbi:hypothetical protein SAMN05192558_102527 [Actinokineospora alba]|uniref:Uncharacterized protein n=1 Tax=Actinokineospora alba TaxID=504798 RepID=A0A1H0IEY4_9PSEU|nr:hypothetical protein [Actinokineospora alba]SDI88862.1 hypothetical protein SAMN05421871_108226 [Actinokineospora alba]SDO29925.1 hypothetical protein SAMN05192558_102527 [Actinokineospora alba]
MILASGLPVVLDLAMEVDLLGPDTLTVKADHLFAISKEAIKRRYLDDLWRAKAATSPRSLSAIVLSEPVVDAVRKELRKRTGHSCDADELTRLLGAEVIRADIS